MTQPAEIHLYLPGILDAFEHWHRDYAVEIEAPNLLRLMQVCSAASKTCPNYKVDVYQQVWNKNFTLEKHYAAACYESDFKKAAPQNIYLASPINLESGLTSLTVAPHVIADIDESESLIMQSALNDYFAEQLWQFEYSQTGRLYVSCPPEAVPHQVATVDAILGQNLLDIVDTKGAIQWHARLNEIQMLLFSLPFNQQREANRQLIVNGLWVWGGGTSTLQQASNTLDFVIGGNREGRVIAHHAAADFLTTYEDHVPQGKGIIIADDCLDAYQAGDIDTWQAAIRDLDKRLFAALANQVENIASIHSCNGYRWRPKKKSLLHFFQKKRSKLTDFFIGEP